MLELPRSIATSPAVPPGAHAVARHPFVHINDGDGMTEGNSPSSGEGKLWWCRCSPADRQHERASEARGIPRDRIVL